MCWWLPLFSTNKTDPDDCQEWARLLRQPVLPEVIEQPNFGVDLAAQIPQVNIPENINAPRQFPMPLILPLGGRYANPAPGLIGALAADQRDTLLPGAAPVNNIAGAQIRPIVGWRDMVVDLPPMPAQPARRGRGRPRHISEPRNILSGPQANVNLNNVHRGQIFLQLFFSAVFQSLLKYSGTDIRSTFVMI